MKENRLEYIMYDFTFMKFFIIKFIYRDRKKLNDFLGWSQGKGL